MKLFVELSDVKVSYSGGLLHRAPKVDALRGVSIYMNQGERHGLVGESGSGKSTLGRVILGLERPSHGSVSVAGFNPFALSKSERYEFRRRVQLVFQDSLAAFNPRLTIGKSLGEGLEIHNICKSSERSDRIAMLLETVGLPLEFADRFPHQVSGGQRQRVNIARALSVEPDVLVADEPVSALDVSIQAEVLDLFEDLQRELNLTTLFISHDLNVIHEASDYLWVLKDGEIVEKGATKQIFSGPEHEYTNLLLGSLPGQGLQSAY